MRRWEDNIKMNLKEIGCRLAPSGSGYGSVRVLVKSVMNIRVA
jgi:hypothetical protein